MSTAPPGYSANETDLGWGSQQADDDEQYELKCVQALRGREGSAKAKWHNQGWELVSESRGTLRTELTFRRRKRKTLGTHLLSIVATFRRLQPKRQLALIASCALVLGASVIGIVVGTRSEADARNPSAAHGMASTAASPETSDPDSNTSIGPNDEQVLTADTSPGFAALLRVPDGCDGTIAPFMSKYSGRTVEFDGSIADMANHGKYDTRFDILVAPGSKGPQSTIGPNFEFEDVNVLDLKLTGASVPDVVAKGDRFRFVATLAEYNPTQCLLSLEPVSTKVG